MGRDFHIRRVSTVARDAVDGTAFQAHLGPTRPTVLTDSTPRVVVVHDTLPNPRLRLADARSHHRDHATWLMPSNDGLRTATNADGGGPPFGTVRVQITPAHAGGFDGEHDLARPRCWVRKLSQFQASIPKEYHAAHRSSFHG